MDVRIGPWRAVRLVGVLVVAFSGEPRRLVGAAGLLRGVCQQFAYRWASGQVRACDADHAVLLWSPVPAPRSLRAWRRAVAGLLAATAVGLLWTGVSGALLAGLIWVLWSLLGLAPVFGVVAWTLLMGFRQAATLGRAIQAYRQERRLIGGLPAAPRRWRIDHLAALPRGRGHGGRLLDRFLAEADAAAVEVVLHCDQDNVRFYRRHGFAAAAGAGDGTGQVVMRRRPAAGAGSVPSGRGARAARARADRGSV